MALPEDIESQLAAMDERLRRLQEELEAQDPLLTEEEAGRARFEREPEPEPVRVEREPEPVHAEREPAPYVEPEPFPHVEDPEAPAAEAPAAPGDQATRIAQEAHGLVDRLTGEIQQLLSLRDQLQASGRILVGDFQNTLARMQAAMDAASALVDPPESIAVTISPVHDLSAISLAAREIGGLPGVREVSVQRFERDTAVLDVHARSAAELAAAVRERLAPGVFVTACTDRAITLTVARQLS